MKGLFLKEWYQCIAYGRTLLLASGVMFVVAAVQLYSGEGSGEFMIYACFLLGVSPMTLLSYDSAEGWTEYSLTFPVSRTALVSSKYIVGLCCTALSSAAAAILLALFGDGLDRGYAVLLLIESTIVPLVSNSLLLPLSYRFGTHKARYFYFVFIAFFAGLLGFSSAGSSPLNHAIAHLTPAVTIPVFLIVLLVYGLSWKLSAAWYGRATD